jgi:hypothetical protein
VTRFLDDPAAMAGLNGAMKLNDVSTERYAAIFLPGGHGTMWDLPANPELARRLSTAWSQGKVLAAGWSLARIQPRLKRSRAWCCKPPLSLARPHQPPRNSG